MRLSHASPLGGTRIDDPKLQLYVTRYNCNNRTDIGTSNILPKFEYAKATTSSEGQTSSSTPMALPLVQNGNTQIIL